MIFDSPSAGFSAFHQLALLIAIRKRLASNSDPIEYVETNVKQACRQTGLIDFIKKSCVLLINSTNNLDVASMRIFYFLKQEVIWIITNITACVDSDTDPDLLDSLLFENDGDLTHSRPSLVLDYLATILATESTT